MRRWTSDEDTVLINQVTRNAGNLTLAFKKASELLNRTESACMIRWYKHLSKHKRANVCFLTLGKGTKATNRKNTNKMDEGKTTLTWWKAILKLLKLIR